MADDDQKIIRVFNPAAIEEYSLEEVNRFASEEWANLHRTLASQLKHYAPQDWAALAASELRECGRDSTTMRRCPPHIVLRSIEACCAYSVDSINYLLDRRRFYKVVHEYMRHNDPVFLRLARFELVHFLIVLEREQITLQHSLTVNEIAKIYLVFADPIGMRMSNVAFQTEYGITILQWMQLCQAAYAAFEADPNGRIFASSLATYAKEHLGLDNINAFLKFSCWTPNSLGTHYREQLETYPPHFYVFIRSALLFHPIIDFGAGRLIAPIPSLVFRHTGYQLRTLLSRLWKSDQSESEDLSHEYTSSFERYIRRALEACKTNLRLLDESAMQSKEFSCDFLLETKQALVLVECKAVEFTRDNLTIDAMRGDSTTRRIIKATHQLKNSYADLIAGRFDLYGIEKTKPVVLIVATFGRIPYVNSDWYFRNVIAPKAEVRGQTPPDGWGIRSRPIVLDCEALELFVMAMNTLNIEPHDLVAKKLEKHGEFGPGEWHTFLQEMLNGSGFEHLSYVRAAFEEFHQTLSKQTA